MASRQQILRKTLLISLLALICVTDVFGQFRATNLSRRRTFKRYASARRYNKRNIKGPQEFVVKFNFTGGKILPLSDNLKLTAQKPTVGGELCLELPSWNSYPWQVYLNEPTLGVGVSFFDLGNKNVLGYTIATYPYMLFNCLTTDFFEIRYKVGIGLSFFNKRYGNCDTIAPYGSETTNIAIGSVVNSYLTTGFNLNLLIAKGFAAHIDVGYSHMSNGSILQPNGGINMVHASIGASYKIMPSKNYRPPIRKFQQIPYKWNINTMLSFGTRQHFVYDTQRYMVGSIHVGATYSVNNWYAVGGGVSSFYNGSFVRQGLPQKSDKFPTDFVMSADEIAEQLKHTQYGRYFLRSDKMSNKFRAGIELNNEIRIGRVTALLDWGVYVYNPVRNAYTRPHKKYGWKRPLLYSYNLNYDDGWNYFRIGLRCRLYDNINVQISMKSHLNRAEMIEFGIGYNLPFARRRNPNAMVRNTIPIIYHPED